MTIHRRSQFLQSAQVDEMLRERALPALESLICGSTNGTDVANTTLAHISTALEKFGERTLRFISEEFTEDASAYGAFCSRVVLENSCAAILGRLDPFRLMYLSEFQSQANYNYGQTSKSTFRWTGDVMSDEKPPASMWSGDHEPTKVSRALLSSYSEHLFWKPGLENLLNYISDNQNHYLNDLKQEDPFSYIPKKRGKAASIYSTLSKGVHWEFFVSSIVMDESTIKSTMSDCISLVAELSLVSHFIPTAICRLPEDEALLKYIEIKEQLL